MEQREVIRYGRRGSVRSWRARRLLARRGYHVEVIDMTKGAPRATLKQLSQNAYRETPPYVFVDHRPVGGFGVLKVLDRSGDLERLVRGAL
jgi:glutaredoxin